MTWPGWENYVPPTNQEVLPPLRKVGRVKGARECWANYQTRELSDTALDGWERFHSRREAHRWLALLSAQDVGSIRHLRRQVSYPLNVVRPDGHVETIAHWTADFVYEVQFKKDEWVPIVEDSKGFKTEMFRRSRRHFQAQYGITIRET